MERQSKRFCLNLELWAIVKPPFTEFRMWQQQRFEAQAAQLIQCSGAAAAYVYLIRFSCPLGSAKHQAQFYLGATTDLASRMKQHCTGRERGSNIVYWAVSKNIPCDLVCVFPFESKTEAFKFESSLKKRRKQKLSHLLK